MDEVIKKICEIKVVPIITISESSRIIPVIQALQKGGLYIAEITLRTAEAIQAISIASKEFPDILLGAGTVLTTEQAGLACENGAKFMVTPGFNPSVVDYCLANQITIIPGLNSPTQIEQALERNITHVKFFPSEASGGISFINAVAGPYQNIRFMATGGINLDNLNHYLSNRYIFACGGSWMVKKAFIEENRFGEITALVKETLKIANDY